MQYLRTFVAIDISPEVQAKAAGFIEMLRQSGVKGSWTKLHNLHMTLKFLGDTPETLLPDVCRAVARAGEATEPFELAFAGLGAFPNLQRPQTLWIGVERGQAEITELFQAVEERLFALRYPRERGRFTPHLTLGRARGGTPQQLADLRRLLEEHAHDDAGLTVVDEVVLYSSMLDRQEGPTYIPLARVPLGGK